MAVQFSQRIGRVYFIAVWWAYCAAEFLVMRHGYHRQWAVPSWFVPLPFAIPVLALGGYWHALAASPYLRPRSLYRHIGIGVLAFAGLFFSTCCWVFLMNAVYGT
jgi:hypothetical protein